MSKLLYGAYLSSPHISIINTGIKDLISTVGPFRPENRFLTSSVKEILAEGGKRINMSFMPFQIQPQPFIQT